MKKSPLEIKCLFWKVKQDKTDGGRNGFGINPYDCNRCDGEKEDCRLYSASKPEWNKYGQK